MNREMLEQYAEYFNKQKGRPYPCSNQIVTCAVITKDRDKALSVMRGKDDAIMTRNNNDCIEWYLNNERWIWKKWNTDYRGYRFYKLIIDKDLDEKLLHWAIVYAGSYCCSMEII